MAFENTNSVGKQPLNLILYVYFYLQWDFHFDFLGPYLAEGWRSDSLQAMWKGVLHLQEEGSGVQCIFLFSVTKGKKIVLLPSFWGQTGIASVPGLVGIINTEGSNWVFPILKVTFSSCLGPSLGRELLWAVSPRDVARHVSLLGCVQRDRTLTGPARCLLGPGVWDSPAWQPRHPICARSRACVRSPEMIQAERWDLAAERPLQPQGLHGDLGPHPFGFTGAAGRAGALGRTPKAFIRSDLSLHDAPFWGSCADSNSPFVASLQKLWGHLLQHLLQ